MFDPEKATRQMFIDNIISALNCSDTNGHGYGWHLTSMDTQIHDGDFPYVELCFETPIALIGWKEGSPDSRYDGPRKVLVTVQAIEVVQLL